MSLNEIITRLAAAGMSAKLARDGKTVVISLGANGFARVHQDGRVEDFSKFSRARSAALKSEIKAALA